MRPKGSSEPRISREEPNRRAPGRTAPGRGDSVRPAVARWSSGGSGWGTWGGAGSDSGGLGRWIPAVAGLPPAVVGLLVLCLILGAGYLGWRQAVAPAAPAGGLPPARTGLLAATPHPTAAFFAGVDRPGAAGGSSAAEERPVGADEPPADVAPADVDRPARIARLRRAAEAVVAARGASRRSEAFAWPVLAPISSPFGPRWGRHHDGIELAANHGDLIRASRDGDVWLAGEVEGYGLTVVIGHDDGTRTLYAHASALLVEAGERVKQGQPIARVGSTGKSTGPHLHFEIIVNDRPVNPLDYLPPRE